MTIRNEFTAKTKDVIARRVGFHCSHPDCGKWTCGPNADPAKYTGAGVAAHITAAAPGGPRYDASLTSEQRRSASNGIWMCYPCSQLIDNDHPNYPVGLIRQWKSDAEEKASKMIQPSASPGAAHSILISAPERIGLESFVIHNNVQIPYAPILDLSEPGAKFWFHKALIHRFMVRRHPAFDRDLLLSNIKIKIKSFTQITDYEHMFYIMAVDQMPRLFHAVIGDPAIEKSNEFIADRVDTEISGPIPLLIGDGEPFVVDLRIDANHKGLYNITAVFNVSDGKTTDEIVAIDDMNVFFDDA